MRQTDSQYLQSCIDLLARTIARVSEQGADQSALSLLNQLLETRFAELESIERFARATKRERTGARR